MSKLVFEENSSLVAITALGNNENLETNHYLLESDGSFAYQNPDIEEVIAVLEAESIPIDQIITHHFPLGKINDGFGAAHSGKNVIKILIDHEV